MIPRVDPPSRLLALAAVQEQVVSKQQCLALGLGRHAVARLVDQGHWHRVLPGIYSLSPDDLGWLARCWVGLLLGGDGSCLGGEAAGHLHGIVADPPRTVTVLVPETARRVHRDGWEFVRQPRGFRLPARGAPQRIVLEDAVLDLCGTADDDQVVNLLTLAVQSHKTNADKLLARLRRRTRSGNRELITEVLGDWRRARRARSSCTTSAMSSAPTGFRAAPDRRGVVAICATSSMRSTPSSPSWTAERGTSARVCSAT